MTRVLLLDPDTIRRERLCRAFIAAGVRVTEASDSEGLSVPDLAEIDVIIANADLPSGDGIALRSLCGDLPLILFTENGSVRRAVEAMQLGACDYLATPFEPDELVAALDRCIHRSEFTRGPPFPSTRMIGDCPEMLELSRRIDAIAGAQTSLLILGESGSGKELVARAVHAASPRRARAMISCNCATIPESLIEAELFGDQQDSGYARLGLLEAANHGTLFLDEIGELTLPAQARLLRMLQSSNTGFGSVGNEHGDRQIERQTDVRLITATHRDLRPLVAAGRFLEDLYARLSAATLIVPPLRERGNDVIELSNWLLQRICHRLSRPVLRLSDAALAAIRRYDWPGNVRELENALERAVILCPAGIIEASLLGIDSSRGDSSKGGSSKADSTNASAHAARQLSDDNDTETSLEGYFLKFVLEHQDALTETQLAAKLGISRKSLWERRQRLNIPRKRTRTRAPRRDGDG